MAAETTPESTTATTPSSSSSARPGKAGRTDYDQWNKVTNDLLEETEQEEQAAIQESQEALGLDGKYARSGAEAEEREKAHQIKHAKKILDNYQKRETAILEGLQGLLGPVVEKEDVSSSPPQDDTPNKTPTIVRVTRDMLEAGKRVVKVSDTSGDSLQDTIVLTSDLSLLESQMKANAMQTPKAYPEDAENAVPANDETKNMRKIYGVIKCFLSNVHNCTILIKCKIISGTLELSHCSNVKICIEHEATVATLQADLCQNLTVEFKDAPSGKNTSQNPKQKLYWGDDTDDRIYHAGVSNMTVRLIRDGYVEMERLIDYQQDGAQAVGNASPEEYQFITSVLDEALVTEAVVREGATTGENARAMTQREVQASEERKQKAAAMAVNMAENMIQFKEMTKIDGEKVEKVTKTNEKGTMVETVDNDKQQDKEEEEEEEEDVVEEVYAGMSKGAIDAIVAECETNKARGNEAFGAGEYAQAILLYTLALDKAQELPDSNNDDNDDDTTTQLFPRDVTLSNRAACFLKMGNHEKALEDGQQAERINPNNVKALFRQGLALHAMKQYEDALPILAKAHKLQPKNRQIKEALQFAEVRMTQEMRKRMNR